MTEVRFTRRSFSALALSFSLFGGARARQQRVSSPYDVILESNHRVALRDGVQLATDVYRPARNGKPVGGKISRHPGAHPLRTQRNLLP